MRNLTFLLLLVSGFAAKADLIVPNTLANVEGNGNNNFPFDSVTPMRYQQVYAASQFPGTVLITAIVFRPDGLTGHAFSVTIPDVQIDLSTTSAAPDVLSSTFASNVGANDTVVFSGPLSLSSQFIGPPGGPKAFDIVINLATPFVYNPAAGNLLLDVRNFAGLPSGAAGGFDSQFAAGDAISRVYGGIGSANAGTEDTEGLVTGFIVAPEPGTLISVTMGMAMMLVARRLRVRQ